MTEIKFGLRGMGKEKGGKEENIQHSTFNAQHSRCVPSGSVSQI
jgi:hypothetical protein